LISTDSFETLKLAQEVDKICSYFLHPRKLSFFQFKRTYKNNTSIILANKSDFFREFLINGFIEPEILLPVNTRQSSFCFWDETLSNTQLSILKETLGIYHGLTILSRRKSFYDCITFARSESHPSPVAYYLHLIKDLQNFSEIFPTKAQHLIKESAKSTLKTRTISKGITRKNFLLPKRSTRLYIGDDVNNYITTYEAICVQLALEGKSYKEIGAMLSMAATTVKTHLIRLKARTGLSLQEISLRSFRAYNTITNIKNGHPQNDKTKENNIKLKNI